MKTTLSVMFAGVFLAGCALAGTNSAPLVDIRSADSGDTNCLMRIQEVERNANTSILRLTYRKMGSSVGSSMFVMSGFYEVAKARGAEYFINLKEWQDPNGGQIYIAGFTNTKDADINQTFGAQYALTNEYGQARSLMSASQFGMLFERRRK